MKPTAIEVEHLRKSFGDLRAVDDISFDVTRGEIFGVLGPNGSGKTTTVECISGLQISDSGRIRIFGLDPVRERAQARRVMGIQLQETKLADRMTVTEALNLFASFYSAPSTRVNSLIPLAYAPKRSRSSVRYLEGRSSASQSRSRW